MTGLLFVTAQSTDVKDLNRILLYLRDWDISAATSTASDPRSQDGEFLDRFRFVTKHNAKTLVSQSSSASNSHVAAHGTFPPVPPSATFVNSWVGKDVEQIEAFMDALASGVNDDKKRGWDSSERSSQGEMNRRDSGYSSTGSIAGASEGDELRGYNTNMYLVVDEVGLATGTATLACRGRNSSTAWDRVRGVPWAEVCSTWKTVEKSGSVDVLFSGSGSGLQQQKSSSRWLDYKRPADVDMVSPPRDCRRRDLEVSMWHECGLV